MSVLARNTVRAKIFELIEPVYTGEVYAVYPYMRTGWHGKSPVVRILNGGSTRPRLAGNAPQVYGTMVRYVVQHFVLFHEQGSVDEQAAAENQLDALEAILAQWITDNYQVPGYWKSIVQVDLSEPLPVMVGGSHQYLLEAFIIEAELHE